jgi:hypothetical protein
VRVGADAVLTFCNASAVSRSDFAFALSSSKSQRDEVAPFQQCLRLLLVCMACTPFINAHDGAQTRLATRKAPMKRMHTDRAHHLRQLDAMVKRGALLSEDASALRGRAALRPSRRPLRGLARRARCTRTAHSSRAAQRERRDRRPCPRFRGGMQAVVAATGYRSLEKVVRLIDPAILTQALDNSARPQGTRAPAVTPRQQRQHASQRAQSLLPCRSSADRAAVYDYASAELDRSSRGFGERGHASMRRRASALVCVHSPTTRSIVPSSPARSPPGVPLRPIDPQRKAR